MSQISPPVRILLVGAIVFLAAWFTVLHPKSDSTVPPAATPAATPTGTPTDGLGRAVAKARGAAATEEAAAKAHDGETAQAQSQPQTGAATKSSSAQAEPAVAIPAAVLAKLPKDVSAALKAHKTLVLGVIADGAKRWRPLADDDRYVRNALGRVNHYKGQVVVKRVPVSSLVTYAPLVGDLQVNQTPSIVVIDGKLNGTVLPGYLDRISINQAIADARRNSIHPLITDPYLRKLNQTCEQYYLSINRWSLPTIPGKKALHSSLQRGVGVFSRYHRAVARIPAPVRWRSLKRQFVGVMAAREAGVRKAFRALEHNDLDGAVAAVQAFDFGKVRKLDNRFDRAGVTGCAINRRS